VEQHPENEHKEISGRLRLLLCAIGLGLIFLLAVAAALKPDPSLYGTHQQLGLPPCTFLVLFGIPCPTCGMTTAWACLMHAEFFRAFQANAGGALMGLSAMAAVPWLMVSAVRGRWLFCKPGGNAVACVTTIIVAILLVQWALRMAGDFKHILNL
jgi:hypothetical protein